MSTEWCHFQIYYDNLKYAIELYLTRSYTLISSISIDHHIIEMFIYYMNVNRVIEMIISYVDWS